MVIVPSWDREVRGGPTARDPTRLALGKVLAISTGYPDHTRELPDAGAASVYVQGMKKILTTLVLILGACDHDPNTSCSVQAEQTCDPGDVECTSAIMDDCVPPVCDDAPPGQHC
jgi:hypothetical protein